MLQGILLCSNYSNMRGNGKNTRQNNLNLVKIFNILLRN